MADAEWRAFVQEGTRTGKLAIVRKDGRPHVVPIWFVLDGDDVVFTTGARSVKAHALRRDRRACLCVDDENPPYAYVMIDGVVSIGDDLENMLRFATAIGNRYMGAERGEEFGRRNAVPGELLVRLTPTAIRAKADITG
jgi:PPOX class probable F420-dependent enzyme